MYKRKRAGNTITRKINSTKDTAAKADKNHYISNSYLEGFIPIDTEYFTASFPGLHTGCSVCLYFQNLRNHGKRTLRPPAEKGAAAEDGFLQIYEGRLKAPAC